MTPQIQEAFDKKYEEIGEDVWHDIGNDRIFYFGWKACESNCATLLSEQDYQYNKQTDELIARHAEQLDIAAEFCRQYQIENKQLRESTADCYEKNLNLSLENFELKAKNNHLQFLLDSVMLEYCPDEMTEEQMENWKKAQKKSNLEIL